jgi:pilus assembly protein Flp/PilA
MPHPHLNVINFHPLQINLEALDSSDDKDFRAYCLCPSGGIFNTASEEMKSLLSRFAADRSGATAIEYGLIAGLIAVVIIAAVSTVGSNLSNKFMTIANNLS